LPIETRFLSEGCVAYALVNLRKEMIELLKEADLTHENINAVFKGWFDQLELVPASGFKSPVEKDITIEHGVSNPDS